MKELNKKYRKFIIYYIFIFLIFIFIVNKFFIKDYIVIENYEKINLKITKAKLNRSLYILNDKYQIYCDYILLNNRDMVNDIAIWRPKDSKFIPCLCDVAEPFELFFKKNSDTLTIIKDNKRLLLLKDYKKE